MLTASVLVIRRELGLLTRTLTLRSVFLDTQIHMMLVIIAWLAVWLHTVAS